MDNFTIMFSVVKRPLCSPVKKGERLTISQVAQLLELKASSIKFRSRGASKMIHSGHEFEVVRVPTSEGEI